MTRLKIAVGMKTQMSSYPHLPSRSKGVALLVVLLLLTIMATIAATMSERIYYQFTRAQHQINYQQAYWYSIGVEALAKVGIKQSYEDGDTINMSQAWALEEQVYPLDYGLATGRIIDKQSCFNVNALSVIEADTQSSRPFLVETLRTIVESADIEPYQSEVIADSIWEFVDSDDRVTSDVGVEDATYESFSPPYLTANHLMADNSELRAVYQVSGDVMEKLHPLLCALPTSQFKLNVNTVSESNSVILEALFSPDLNSEAAKELVANRPFDGWDNIEAFMEEANIASLQSQTKENAQPYLTVDSQFFELDALVEVDESQVRIRSLLYSQDREDITVVRRRFGGVGERVSDRPSE